MNSLTLNIEPNYINRLRSIAKSNGETTDQFVSKIIDEYLARMERDDNINLMKLSENSFSEWDNEDDAIYDTLQ